MIYLFFLAAYLAACSGRLRRPSQYNHFVYLAKGWLQGRLDIPVFPPNENDWAKVDVLVLRDGSTVKRIFKSGSPDRFRPWAVG